MLSRGRRQYYKEFWALRDISFEVKQGETFGIIGRNGSGKSTLLQILAGTLAQTSGEALVKGRVAALLELGSGFNPEFTGRENVYLNGSVLGLTQREIEDRYDQIVEFADIGEFINQPVKTYSSGMFVRLAFAVQAHIGSDILIIDEALSVGDIFFQQKCFRHLESLREQGVSIIFVSHDTQAMIKLCDRAIILKNGYLKNQGKAADMAAKYIELYHSQFHQTIDNQYESQSLETKLIDSLSLKQSVQDKASESLDFIRDFRSSDRYGCAVGLIYGIAISDSQGKPRIGFHVGEEIVLSIKIDSHSPSLCPLNIGFQVRNRMGQVIIGTNTCMINEVMAPELFGKSFICQFKFNLSIFPDQYTISPAIAEYKYDSEIVYDWIESAAVIETYSSGKPEQIGVFFPEINVKINE
jgi:lipopolysaccharide transport system ATP-binding protein